LSVEGKWSIEIIFDQDAKIGHIFWLIQFCFLLLHRSKELKAVVAQW
jgi:hypothetical protein